MEMNNGLSYSQTLRMSRNFLGPQARVIQRGSWIRIGVQEGSVFVEFGAGKNLGEAFRAAFKEGLIAAFQKKAVDELDAAKKAEADPKIPIAIDSESTSSISSDPNSVLENG